ncbi:hypothetical protein J437_LFUL011269 [Ladona fulva]|uniref:Uncharacterized protein n=1 Tax=Ladona fulva TaxID=123851 RepID=A0A8K0KF30_LADFU|nr:hypothetical protein J437_LFUL011269 [Ladona fulva]
MHLDTLQIMKGARLRSYIFGFVGLALNVYILINNQKKSMGLKGIPQSGKLFFPLPFLRGFGFESIPGSESFYAILNAAVSSLLLVGINKLNELLLMPSLAYSGSELMRAASAGIVKTFLIYSKDGFYSAGKFACFTFLVLTLVIYLWFAIPQVCEEICMKKASLRNATKKYLQLEKAELSSTRNNLKTYSISNDDLEKFLVSAKEVEKKLLKQLEDLQRGEGLKMLDSGGPLSIDNPTNDGES